MQSVIDKMGNQIKREALRVSKIEDYKDFGELGQYINKQQLDLVYYQIDQLSIPPTNESM